MILRREFIGKLTSLLGGAWASHQSGLFLVPRAYGQTQSFYEDLRVTVNVGNPITLTAEQLKAGQAVSFSVSEGPGHTHPIQISAAQIAQINAGQRVNTATERAQGHTHNVTIDPNNKVPGGNRIPRDDAGNGGDPNNGNNGNYNYNQNNAGQTGPASADFDVVFSADDKDPVIYARARVPIQPGTVRFALNGAWDQMELVEIRQINEQIYKTPYRVDLKSGELLEISATRADGQGQASIQIDTERKTSNER